MTESNAPKPDRTWLYVAGAFVAFWGLYLTFFGPGPVPAPRVEPSGSHGQADYRWKLLDLDDKPVEFSRYKGKVVFLNVWATWCGPCVSEMPSIARLASKPALKDDVAFVCVSTDDSASAVTQFLAGKDWPMTVLRATDLPRVFQTEGIPATFMIAPDGRIAAAEVGSSNWDDPGVVEALVTLAKAGK